MSPGAVVTLILVIGVALVVAATIADRRSAARIAGTQPRPLVPRPDAGDEPREPPNYVTADQLLDQAPPAAAFSPEQERALAAQLADASTTRVDCRLASANLATHTGLRAILDQPALLICADTVGPFRELMALLAAAAADRIPLVIAAPAMDAETLQTLVANKLAGKLELAVIFGDATALSALSEATGSVQFSQAERQAGSPALRSLRRPDRIVASQDATWLLAERSSTTG